MIFNDVDLVNIQNATTTEASPYSLKDASEGISGVENDFAELAKVHEDVFYQKGYGGSEATAVNTAIQSITDGYPKGHLAFDEQGVVALPGVGASAIVLDFTVPDGYDGLVKWMSNNLVGASFSSVLQEVVWRVLADGKPIRNFENIISQKGTPEIPRPVEGIRLYSRQRIQMIVEHQANAGLAGEVMCSLSGHYVPVGH